MEAPQTSTETPNQPRRPVAYFETTRTATYSFLASLPLFLAYEVLIAFVNRGQLQQVRIGAEVWIKQLVALVGGTGVPVLAIGVAVVGILIFFLERKRRPRLVPRYFGWMIAESLVYAIALGFLVSMTVGALFAMVPVPNLDTQSFTMQFALSLGAGLYEELVFRVFLVGGLFWILKKVLVKQPPTTEPTGSAGSKASGFLGKHVMAYIIAAVVGALIFSAVHYTGSLGDAFTLSSFTFRFLFGLALNALFLLRGFGVAAWAHALYDVSIVVGLWNWF